MSKQPTNTQCATAWPTLEEQLSAVKVFQVDKSRRTLRRSIERADLCGGRLV